jgi:tetratricopeptide (TPR) repeat protein
VDPESPEVVRSLAVVQVDAGQYEDAIRNAQWVLDRYPTYPYTAVRIGRAHALSGRLDEALRVFEEDRSGLGYLGYVHARAGRRDEADALAAKAVSPMMQFLIYGGLGDKERAFEALDRVHAENPWRAATWMMRPEVAVLRDDPRFAAMRRRLRIPNN